MQLIFTVFSLLHAWIRIRVHSHLIPTCHTTQIYQWKFGLRFCSRMEVRREPARWFLFLLFSPARLFLWHWHVSGNELYAMILTAFVFRRHLDFSDLLRHGIGLIYYYLGLIVTKWFCEHILWLLFNHFFAVIYLRYFRVNFCIYLLEKLSHWTRHLFQPFLYLFSFHLLDRRFGHPTLLFGNVFWLLHVLFICSSVFFFQEPVFHEFVWFALWAHELILRW